MSDLFPSDAVPISLIDEVMAVEREIRYRRRVYPRLILNQKMRQGEADREIAIMEAIAKRLRALMHPGRG